MLGWAALPWFFIVAWAWWFSRVTLGLPGDNHWIGMCCISWYISHSRVCACVYPIVNAIVVDGVHYTSDLYPQKSNAIDDILLLFNGLLFLGKSQPETIDVPIEYWALNQYISSPKKNNPLNHWIQHISINPNKSSIFHSENMVKTWWIPMLHGFQGPYAPMVFTSPGPPQPKARGAHGWRSAVRPSAGGSRGPELWHHRAAGDGSGWGWAKWVPYNPMVIIDSSYYMNIP